MSAECFTPHIGSNRFAAFRTRPGKSRLVFLRRLLGGAARYLINAAAIVSMREANLPRDVIDKLASHSSLAFGSREEWMSHLRALGIADLRDVSLGFPRPLVINGRLYFSLSEIEAWERECVKRHAAKIV
jgi:hypothetical protein